MFQKLAATLAALVLAGAAHAATETFDFTQYHAGETDVWETSKEFVGDMGGTVEVTMGTFYNYISYGRDGGGYVGQWDNYGLGVCSLPHDDHCHEAHSVDGWGYRNDYLKFSLEENAVLESITFMNYYGDGTYDLSTMDGDLLLSGAYSTDVSGTDVGSMFFVGAWNGASFTVQSITVSYADVPLPAAGFLLLAGMGGLAALRRRK